MMRSTFLICLLAACGDNLAPAAGDAASCGDASCIVSCSASFSGNFEETSNSPKSCPQLMPGAGDGDGHTMIFFLVPPPPPAPSLGVKIDLGPPPTMGFFSAKNPRLWNAVAIKSVPIKGA